MAKGSFLRGTMLLAVTGLFSKVLGAIYIIPLTRLLGAEGIGLYQMAYSAYGLALVISTSGVPVAVSKLVAERVARGNRGGARTVFRIGLWILFTVGSFLALALFLGARFFAERVIGDPRASLPIKALAPAVLVVSVMGAFRGYFQGLEDMLPTALSQTLEQLVRVITGLVLAFTLLPRGIEYATCGPTLGAFTGGVAGFVFLVWVYVQRGLGGVPGICQASAGNRSRPEDVISPMLGVALPVTLASFAMPLTDALNAAIVPGRLQSIGFGVQDATRLYGYFEGMAMALVMLPTVVTQALSISIIPSIAGAYARRRRREVVHRVRQGLRLAILIGFPAFWGLALLARPICLMLFNAPEAGTPLSFLAVGSLFLCIQQAASGILQGLSRPFVPARNLILGSLCGGLLSYLLTGIPSLGIKGAAMGTAMGFAFAGGLNLLSVRAVVREPIGLGASFIRGAISSMLMGFVVVELQGPLLLTLHSNALTTLASIGVGALTYFCALLFLREVRHSDIELVPMVGPRLAWALGHMGLLRR